MSDQWTIQLLSRPLAVAGFAKPHSARAHVLKHYLNPMERWEQVEPDARGAISQAKQVGETHGKVSPQYYAFADASVPSYVRCVRVETEQAVRVLPVPYVDQKGQRVRRIEAVTRSGVYAAFSEVPDDQVSDLRTAMRQYYRSIKNPRSSDFLIWAHAHLNARLQGARFSDD